LNGNHGTPGVAGASLSRSSHLARQGSQVNQPQIIQGGMGVAVSAWPLARAVAMRGQLGVVSGTGLDVVLARRLQLGDPGGHMKAAFAAFPIPEVARRVWDRYFVAGGKQAGRAFKSKPLPAIDPSQALTELLVVANFAEVFLAKQGHRGLVGINLLEKIQLPTLPSLFGAMLAGVDYVLMGAGIPRAIPGALDRLAALEPAELPIDVAGAQAGESFVSRFDPRSFLGEVQIELNRPWFLAIIASATLALTLARRSTGKVDGFVVEGPTAGGHNAPPRGAMVLDERGEPVYGERDEPDLEAIRQLGLPFWLAGSYGRCDGLRRALEAGAAGIQVGTAFAYCEESGLAPDLKARVLGQSAEHAVAIHTDPFASPTGFPFKVVQVPETLSEEAVYRERTRICDLGYLRQSYRKDDGTVGYRCAGEPVEDYLKKGGRVEDTVGRKCVCNGLLAAIGLAQVRKGVAEPPLLTAGEDVAEVARFLEPGRQTYTAADVLDRLLGSEGSS
jgi:nitronate monooxygenase